MSLRASRQASPFLASESAGAAALRPSRAEAAASPAHLGNQDLQRLLLSGAVQAKLTLSQPGDPYEQEADQVADAVVRMPEPGAPAPGITALPPATLQRKCAACEAGGGTCAGCTEEEEQVQRKAEGTEPLPPTDASILPTGGGQALAPGVLGFFESRFGRGFGNVRVHTGAAADASARSVNALAYTHGSDIVFRSGQYAPQTTAGQRLLAHELTHVVQQGGRSTAMVQRKCTTSNKKACSDEDLLTAVGIGEAGNINDTDGKQGPMNVVMNRVADGAFGADIHAVTTAPGQFRGLNNGIRHLSSTAPGYAACRPIAQAVLAGTAGDPTQGALFFNQSCEKPCKEFCTGYLGDGKSRAHYFSRRATADEKDLCKDRKKNPTGTDRRCCITGRKKNPPTVQPGPAPTEPSTPTSPTNEQAPMSAQPPTNEPPAP